MTDDFASRYSSAKAGKAPYSLDHLDKWMYYMCWVDVEKTHGAIRSCYIFKVAKKRVMSREHWVWGCEGGWMVG